MATADYQYGKIGLWLVAAGVEIPIVAAQLSFELNSIPRAAVVLPVGREGYAGNASPVHALAALDDLIPAKIMCRVSGRSGDDGITLPDGDFVLFDGRTAGTGYARSSSPPSAGYTLQLEHWLGDLNYSSVFSRYSQPTNPAQYSAAAIYPSGSGEAGRPIPDGLYDYADNIQAANIAQDLFEKAILPYFKDLAKYDGLRVEEAGVPGGPADNSEAAAALGRIKSGGKLALAATGDDVAGAIELDLGKVLAERGELAGHTFWDVLVGGCAPTYLFAVSPRIDDALVVPYVPSFKTPLLTITGGQYYGANLSGSTPRPLRAVGVFTGLLSDTGAGGRPEKSDEMRALGVGGWFQHPTRKMGMVQLLSAPRWANLFVPGDGVLAASAGAFGKVVALGDQPNAVGPPDLRLPAARNRAAAAYKSFLDRYARYIYSVEEAKQRQGVISGPLRLDIAPGSTVKVEAVGEQFLKGRDATAESFLGSVLRVSYSIDAVSMTASTSYHLAYVRTESQNEQDGRALDSHPIYSGTWAGAPLRDK